MQKAIDYVSDTEGKGSLRTKVSFFECERTPRDDLVAGCVAYQNDSDSNFRYDATKDGEPLRDTNGYYSVIIHGQKPEVDTLMALGSECRRSSSALIQFANS